MSTQGHTNLELLTIRLFGFETTTGYSSSLWQNPQAFTPYHQQAFVQWKSTKRSFSREEIIRSTWVYVNLQGTATILKFSLDKNIQGSYLFYPNYRFRGSWDLDGAEVGAVLIMRLQNQSQYIVLANRNNAIHSGIAFQGGQSTPHYFKLIQVS